MKSGNTRIRDFLLAAGCVAAIAASVWTWARDRQSRSASERFVGDFTIDVRRPEVARTITLAPGSAAAELLADATLRDVIVPVNLNEASPEQRGAWIRAVAHYDEQMSRASDLMLDCIAARPGWPYHRSLLGKLVFARGSRSFSADLVKRYRLWQLPLFSGASAAAADDSLWQSLALMYLQTWPDLAGAHEATSKPVFTRAFADPEFVRKVIGPSLQIIGAEKTLASLPESPAALLEASRQLAGSGDPKRAWDLYQRWDRAEWISRERDLDLIGLRLGRGDIDDARRLCLQWTIDHSVRDYDSPASHRQAARLLDLWPEGAIGRWPSDPRAQIIAYFLAGRNSRGAGAGILRAIGSLNGVPAPVEAQVRVNAGDISGAESIATASSDSIISFEWKPYLLELARHWIRKGDRARARAALERIPEAARHECDVEALYLLVDGTPASDDPRTLELTWSNRIDTPICFQRSSAVTLALNSVAPEGTVVDYGWDGARSGSVFLPPQQTISVSMPVEAGARHLTAGVPIQPGDHSIVTRVVSR